MLPRRNTLGRQHPKLRLTTIAGAQLSGPGITFEQPGLAILLRHTDADREWAYDRESKIGHLDKALDEANQRGWVVVDMKEDWRIVFPWELN